MYRILGASGGRGERRVADEESTRARLQYLSAPESGGRQPRIHHEVNDPLLLDPQTGVVNAAAALREDSVDIAVATLRVRRVEKHPVQRREDRRILLNAATHGITGTYDKAAQSIRKYRTLGSSGGRGEERVAGDEVRELASSMDRPGVRRAPATDPSRRRRPPASCSPDLEDCR